MCFNIMKLLFHITNILKVIQALFTIFYFKYINKKSQNQKIYLNENRVVGINKSVNFQYFCDITFLEIDTCTLVVL